MNPNEEHLFTPAQRRQFHEDLRLLGGVRTILVVGIHLGQSVEFFLESIPHVKVVSTGPRMGNDVELLQTKYGQRFVYLENRTALKKYAEQHREVRADLIFLDGGVLLNECREWISDSRQLARPHTVLWVDDCHLWEVSAAFDACMQQRMLRSCDFKYVRDEWGFRHWASARYRYLSDTEQIFDEIYRVGLWGKNAQGEGTSGAGSSLERGRFFVQYLQKFLDEHEISSVVDLGCGDWTLAREINWGKSFYVGMDIVSSVIDKNRTLYGAPNIQFLERDILRDPWPEGDLLICKDVMIHLPNSMIADLLTKASFFSYSIFVNDIVQREKRVVDGAMGGFHHVNLTLPPFYVQPCQMATYRSGRRTKQIIVIEIKRNSLYKL